jgi:pimeloyl-ACP methyl ester carboxylesterase
MNTIEPERPGSRAIHGNMFSLAVDRIVQPVEGMHRAISAPWFAALGAVGRPIRAWHDFVSGAVYSSIRIGAEVLGNGLDARSTPNSRLASRGEALVNGLWGDDLGRHERVPGSSMSVRDPDGAPVRVGPDAFPPTTTNHLVVLVHGLVETERCWYGTDSTPGLIDTLQAHPDLTPIAIRYNTGRAVATNGAQLASLLEEITTSWPEPVHSISLVGHSMGGLVIRSACTSAIDRGHRWIRELSDLVTIGTPHGGAPLEKLVTAAAWGLRVAPQTRPLADFLDTRSQGIKDLRSGNVSPAAPEQERNETRLEDVRNHFIAGVITSNPHHPIASILGDLMVRPASSTQAPPLEAANIVIVGGVSHFDLTDEPAVIEQVMEWLARTP